LANYYQELITRIAEHISREEYQEASELIEEELKLPYVPMDTYDRLISFRDQIKGYLSKEPSARFLSEKEVFEGLCRGGENAYQAISFLKKVNIREYLDIIQEYLLSDQTDRMIISVLFDLCRQQEVGRELQYCDNGCWHSVRPSLLEDVTDNETFAQTLGLLQERFENRNPSFMQLCFGMLGEYAYLRYPQPLDKDSEKLTDQIVRYVCQLNGDEEGWKEYVSEYGIDEKAIPELF
jgi:hypothetical protein